MSDASSVHPLILVSNDDGVDAPGLSALAAALAQLGEVVVVAPDRERSGVARAISLGHPLRMMRRRPGWYAVDGTPTDCIYLAIHRLLPRRPTLVVSGINRGPNLADDVTYSGTVAAAMEAALVGVPAVAVSLVGEEPMDYGPAAQFAVEVARLAISEGIPPRALLNVNVPDTRGAPVTTFRWTVGGRRDYGHVVTTREDPRGLPYHWIGGRFLGYVPTPGSDCDAIAEGVAAITPLDLDLTHHALLARLRVAKLPGLQRLE
jgi:5'-nucleotidase